MRNAALSLPCQGFCKADFHWSKSLRRCLGSAVSGCVPRELIRQNPAPARARLFVKPRLSASSKGIMLRSCWCNPPQWEGNQSSNISLPVMGVSQFFGSLSRYIVVSSSIIEGAFIRVAAVQINR
jgi:hypothetical protein